MNRYISLCVLACTVLATQSVWAQGRFDGVEIKSTKITDHVCMLEGSGGNLGVSLGKDGVLLIDDQFAPLAKKIQAAITKLGGDAPKFILNTHWHGDHTGGNETFGKTGTIIAHTNVWTRLSTPQELFGRTIDPLADAGLPVITYDDGISIHFNGEEIRVFHLPHGHTDGDSVVVFTESNVVHMGDLMFMGMFPFVDLDHGGDVEGVLRNVTTVLSQVRRMESAKPGVKIIPGHGPLSSADDLNTYRRMLEDTIGVVRKGIDSGKSLNEIQAAGIPKKWKPWGEGFIKTDAWLEAIHRSLMSD